MTEEKHNEITRRIEELKKAKKQNVKEPIFIVMGNNQV